MTIVEALRANPFLKVKNGDRWLVPGEAPGTWAVYEKLFKDSCSRNVMVTNSEDEAVNVLLESTKELRDSLLARIKYSSDTLRLNK